MKNRLPVGFERIGTQTVESRMALSGLEQHHLPEFPDVAEVDLGSAVDEIHRQMGVLVGSKVFLLLGGQGRPRGGRKQPDASGFAREELAGHPEVNQQAAAVVEYRQEVLPSPLQAPDDAILHAVPEDVWGREKEIAIGGGLNGLDAPVHQ